VRQAHQDVGEFHRATQLPVGDQRAPEIRNVDLRLDLICEEVGELFDAVAEDDVVAAAGELADVIYVVVGAAVEWGIDLPAVWAEVHASNMRKVGGPVRADGKRLKPEGWVGPDVAAALRRGTCGCAECEWLRRQQEQPDA
jgi:predicted HAD superfamily Cof-like phosphohydrolase